MGALVLEIGETAGFFSPNPAGFEPNFKAVDQCKQSFYESLQVLAKEAAALPQAGRLSGEAITTMQKPMEVLIGSFAWPIEDALNRLIEKLKVHRGEPGAEITVEGFGRVDVDDAEVEELIKGEDEDERSGEEATGTATKAGRGTVEED